jgi:metal-responsive CopG/Arc/MetJ family transcriptional regulator
MGTEAKKVTLDIPADLLKKIDQEAKKTERTRSAMIRLILKAWAEKAH